MHTANQPYNVLDGASKQKNPRSPDDLARLNRYAPVLRSYCAAGDPVCAGGAVVADHLNYFELYTDQASSWVISKLAGTAPLCAATSSTPVPVVSSTPAPVVSSTPVAIASSTLVPAASPSVSATKDVPAPSATVSASAVGSYPTSSPATPSPFPSPVDYDACLVVYEVKYEYV